MSEFSFGKRERLAKRPQFKNVMNRVLGSLIVFLLGLVAEQITSLTYQTDEYGD